MMYKTMRFCLRTARLYPLGDVVFSNISIEKSGLGKGSPGLELLVE